MDQMPVTVSKNYRSALRPAALPCYGRSCGNIALTDTPRPMRHPAMPFLVIYQGTSGDTDIYVLEKG